MIFLTTALAADIVEAGDTLSVVGPAVVLDERAYRAYVGDRLTLAECRKVVELQRGAVLDAGRAVVDAKAIALEQLDVDEEASARLEAAVVALTDEREQAARKAARLRAQRDALLVGGFGLVVGLVVGGVTR